MDNYFCEVNFISFKISMQFQKLLHTLRTFFLNRHAGRRGIHAPNELQRLHASRNVFQVVLSYLRTDDYGIKNEAKVALDTER